MNLNEIWLFVKLFILKNGFENSTHLNDLVSLPLDDQFILLTAIKRLLT